jgi:sugar/nucleoside kinase (ribokinase family)
MPDDAPGKAPRKPLLQLVEHSSAAFAVTFEPGRRFRPHRITVLGTTFEIRPSPPPPTAFPALVDKIARLRSRQHDLLAVSAHNMDHVVPVDRVRPDHESAVTGPELRCPGGQGANTAYVLATQRRSVIAAGCVGQHGDKDGDALLASLTSRDIGIKLIRRVPHQKTGTATALLEDETGKRLLVVRPHANDHFAAHLETSVLAAAARTARVLHLSSFVDEPSLQWQARLVDDVKDDCFISLRPGALNARWGLAGLARLLQHADLVFLYREELQTLLHGALPEDDQAKRRPPKPVDELLAEYFARRAERGHDRPQVVLVKDPLQIRDGRITSRFLTAAAGTSRIDEHSRPPLPQAVRRRVVKDTTGAGDAAAAGFIWTLLDATQHDSDLLDRYDRPGPRKPGQQRRRRPNRLRTRPPLAPA